MWSVRRAAGLVRFAPVHATVPKTRDLCDDVPTSVVDVYRGVFHVYDYDYSVCVDVFDVDGE